MLNVMFDVGDKVNRELKTYGANITVIPRGASLLDGRYGVTDGEGVADQYLAEAELGNIKTIFWAFNIVDFAPYLPFRAGVNRGEQDVTVAGAWFHHTLALPTGESVTTGMGTMKNWWDLDGYWAEDDSGTDAMVGAEAAARFGIAVGDSFRINAGETEALFVAAGIFSSGGDEDRRIYIPLAAAQELTGKAGQVSRIEVSALTTPDNELSRRAAQDPGTLSIKEWETWYCTAYVSAICYQIDEALTGSVSKPVRQVAESEGAILEKTRLLMLLITLLSLAGSALGISNLVTASVMERSGEIGLLKALGAFDSAVSALVLGEILCTAAIGGAIGYGAGLGFAQIIGHTVFSAQIALKPQVIPLTAAMVVAVTLSGSLPAIRLLLSLRPAEVLHGR
jgi:putative ABC transport system permease protein